MNARTKIDVLTEGKRMTTTYQVNGGKRQRQTGGASGRSKKFPRIPGLRRADFADIGNGLYSGVVKVTPSMAREWLDNHNHQNRGITKTRVKRYADEITSGNWQLNGEPALFDSNGEMRSFQHRALAVVMAQVPIETVVTVCVAPETMSTIDTGSTRSAGAIFGMMGHPNANVLGGALRRVYNWEHGVRFNEDVAPILLEETLARHPDLPSFVDSDHRLRIRGFPTSTYAALAYLFSRANPELEREMNEGLISGVGLAAGDPVHTLRETAIRNQASTSRIPIGVWWEYIIKTWNGLCLGKQMRLLRRDGPGGPPLEIHGLERPRSVEAG